MMGQLISETHFEECISNLIKYLKSYQYPQALAMIHEAMVVNDTSATVYNLLGIYYEMKGEYSHARKLYLASSSLDASFLPAMNNLNRLVSYSNERTLEVIDFG